MYTISIGEPYLSAGGEVKIKQQQRIQGKQQNSPVCRWVSHLLGSPICSANPSGPKQG